MQNKEKMMWFRCSKIIGGFGSDAGRCTNYGIWGGEYIRKACLSLRAVVWISGTEWLDPLLSH